MPTPRPSAVLAAAALAAVASGCATSKGFTCPAHGGAAWREVASEHFILRSDLAEGEAKGIVREMEAVRATMLAGVFGGAVPTRGRVEVVAFRSTDELLPFARSLQVRGLAYSGDFGERTIVLARAPDAETGRLVAHEISHVVSAYAVPQQPAWFAEGLATFLEGIGEPGLTGARAMGSPPNDSPEFEASARRPPTRDVLEWRATRWMQEDLYARSFVLVHYLFTTQRPRFDAFRARLARQENPRDAWNATFPEWSLDVPGAVEKLDAELAAHARRSYARLRVAVPAGEPAVTIRLLSPAEVHAVRLRLPHRWTPEAEREEIDEALAEDPGHVEALAARARRDRSAAPKLARVAVAAHPDDPAAWELLAASLGDDAAADRVDALRRAVALAPDRVRARLLLARELGARGDLEEALALTSSALALAPWSANGLLMHGRVLGALGRCEEAIAFGWRAVGIAVHSGPDAHRWAGTGVAEIEQGCRERPPPAPPAPAPAAAPAEPAAPRKPKKR